MNHEDLARYTAEGSQPGPDVDLDEETWHDRSGRRVTEQDALDYTTRRGRGRPTLSGRPGRAGQLTLRVTSELRRDVEDIAAAEGRPVAEIARAALEAYVDAHRARRQAWRHRTATQGDPRATTTAPKPGERE